MKKRVWILFFSGFLFWSWMVAVQAQAPLPSKGQKFYEESVARMEKGDFDGAIPGLEKAVEVDKEFAAAYYALAVCHARKKSPDTAAARKWHKDAIALGYQYNEWLETFCDQLDKQKPPEK